MILSSDWVRRRTLALELRLIRSTSLFDRIPLLRHLHRNITAHVEPLGDGKDTAAGVRVRFMTPYLHLPIEVDKTQVGHEDRERGFTAAAFRYFDWLSWTHIEGAIEWIGARTVDVNGRPVDVIRGFVYRASANLSPNEHIGLRVAEGVEGTVRVLWGRRIRSMRFEPVHWMLLPAAGQRCVLPIKDMRLTALIVSLSVIGGGDPQGHAKAIERLEGWIRYTLGGSNPQRTALAFLRFVRDWGPLGMEPLFLGLKEVLERLRIPDQEKMLFEFYAGNCGIWDNRQGRLLAVKMLQALGTAEARLVLHAIHNYARHRETKAEELELIQGAIGAVSTRLQDMEHQA